MSDSDSEIEEITNKFRLQNLSSRHFKKDSFEQSLRYRTISDSIINSELENILDQVMATSNQSQNQSQNPSQINYSFLRLYIDTIPVYDGNPHILNIFIDTCQSLITNFYREGNDGHNNFIMRAIIGRLSGRALSLIGSRIHELNSWDQIKNLLNLSFGDQRNLDCLVQDLIILKPDRNETPYNFGMRCQDARSLVFSKLNMLSLNPAEHTIKIANYEELALKTFIRGLSGQLQNNIRLRDPKTLEKAMSLVIEEENFLYSQNKQNLVNNNQTFQLNQRFTPVDNPFSKPINFQNNNSNLSFPKLQNNNPFQNNPFLNNPFQSNPFLQNSQKPLFSPYNNFKNNSQQNLFRPNNQSFNNRPNSNQFPMRSNVFPRPTFQPFNRQMNYPQRSNFQQNFNQNPKPFFKSSQVIKNQNLQKPEPMEVSSGRNAVMHPKQNLLFSQNINPVTQNDYPNETFDCSQYYCEEYPDYADQEYYNYYCNNENASSNNYISTTYDTQEYNEQLNNEQFNNECLFPNNNTDTDNVNFPLTPPMKEIT